MDVEDKNIEELLDSVLQDGKPYFLEWFQYFNGICSDQEARRMTILEIKNTFRDREGVSDPEKNFIKKLLSDKSPGYCAKRVAESFLRNMKLLSYWQPVHETLEDEFTEELLDTVLDINDDLLLDWFRCFNGSHDDQRLKVKGEIKNTLRDKQSQRDPQTNFLMRLISDEPNGYRDGSGVCKKRVLLAEIFMHAMKQKPYWNECVEATDRYSLLQNIEDAHIISRVKMSLLNLEQVKQKYRQQNNNWVDPLHEAARLDDVETVRNLTAAEDSNIIETDDHDCTPLHSAAMAIYPNAEIARMIVEAMKKNGSRGMINKQSDRDSGRNTALHIAAGNVNVTQQFIDALKDADPVVFNSDGHSPFHVAAKSKNQSAIVYMLKTFAPTNNRWDVDDVDDHELLLPVDRLINICAINGNAEAVALLIQHGADISRGVLHEIVRESVISPQRVGKLVNVYHAIVDNAVTWRCLEEDQVNHDYRVNVLKGSRLYRKMLRETMIWLLTHPLDEYNHQDVLECAISCGASTMFQQIVNTNGVMRHVNVFIVRFDVTNFTKETTPLDDTDNTAHVSAPSRVTQQTTSEKKEDTGLLPTGSDDDAKARRPRRCFDRRQRPRMPYLTYLLSCFDLWKSSNILSTQPLNQLTKPYFALIQRFYLLVGLLQLLFVVLFSVYYMPNTCSLSLMFSVNITHRSSSTSNSSSSKHVDGYDNISSESDNITQQRSSPTWLWLIWPIILITGSVVGSYYSAKYANFRTRGIQNLKIVKCTSLARKLCKGLLESIALRIFSCAVLAWFYKYHTSETRESYIEVTATVLLFGCIINVQFFGAVSQNINISALVVREIIAKDIPSFMLFFGFTVVGFSFAMHALRMSTCELNIYFQDTFYGVLSSAFGIGNFLENMISDRSCVSAGTQHLFEAVYFTYIGATMIILLNVLIAMMNSRYDLAKQRAENIWRFRILSTMTAVEGHRIFTSVMKKYRILDLWRPHEYGKSGLYETCRSQLCYFCCCFHDKYKGYVKYRDKDKTRKTFSLYLDQVE